MKCKYCKEEVTLIPSAQERARKTGMPASFFVKLFDAHSSCIVAVRSAQAIETIRKIAEDIEDL